MPNFGGQESVGGLRFARIKSLPTTSQYLLVGPTNFCAIFRRLAAIPMSSYDPPLPPKFDPHSYEEQKVPNFVNFTHPILGSSANCLRSIVLFAARRSDSF